jgi:hypothetical protein
LRKEAMLRSIRIRAGDEMGKLFDLAGLPKECDMNLAVRTIVYAASSNST